MHTLQLERGLRAEFERLVRAVNEEGKQQQEEADGVEEKQSPSRLCLSSGLLAEVKFGPGKALARVQDKCDQDQSSPRSVLDYSRLTVVFADPSLLARFHDELRQQGGGNQQQQGPQQEPQPNQPNQPNPPRLRVVRVVNKFKLPKPWAQPPNVHINFEFEGHVCEVQLILEDFLLIKDYSHKPYELVRLAPRDPLTNRLNVDLMAPDKLDKAIEFVAAEGVYCKHPGPNSWPSSASPSFASSSL